MIPYAGIGSRTISEAESVLIKKIANSLRQKDFVVYSGNAEGADIAFQEGSQGKCVIMLPWLTFNKEEYDPAGSLDHFDLGDSVQGLQSVDKFHPAPTSLKDGGRRMMARNYHQIAGYRAWPEVKFVICCGDKEGDGVKGGTGQAVRIANSLDIPVFNLRYEDEIVKLRQLITDLLRAKGT